MLLRSLLLTLIMSLVAVGTVVAIAEVGPGVGPDITVSDLYDPRTWDPGDGPWIAYAFGTEACNVGDEEVSWRNGGVDARHPVIAQNMYRLRDGVLVQIGQAWLKHGVCAIDGDDCGVCQGNAICEFLGVGCSDPYAGSLNGFQASLGPRSEVNALTGGFAFPPGDPPWSGVVDRRVRVARADVEAESNPGATWFAEAQYIANDDAIAGNGLNNVSYRQVLVHENGELDAFTGPTIVTRPAIYAWTDATVRDIPIPGEGEFVVGSLVRDLGDGLWRYDYAVFNKNSDRAAGSFRVPLPPAVAVSDIGFHDVDSHSGEIFDTTDWTGERLDDEIRWSTESFGVNPAANALRWGTMYNFWFTANVPPQRGTATIGLFKPFFPSTQSMVLEVPGPSNCPADCAADGVIDVDDLLAVLAAWLDGSCDPSGDGVTGIDDLLAILGAWGPCP